MIFENIIIGKGLVGAAAAKYLQKNSGDVAIIGPDEPDVIEDAIVFSSHYDEGRIQRIIGLDEVWTLLNYESSKQYSSIESESGIKFHNADGCLYVNPTGMDNYLHNAKKLAGKFLSYQFFETGKTIYQQFPGFNFPGSSAGIFERELSGSINPRLLIKAQLKLFENNKGVIINDVVLKVKHERNHFTVYTNEKKTYHSKNVLLCPGAFINFFDLTEKKLSLDLKSETVLLAEVSAKEAARLSTLPSLLYEINEPEYQNIYLIKPLKYPDEKYYLKMGCNLKDDIHFKDLGKIQHWFKEGNSDKSGEVLKEALMKIMPSLQAVRFTTARCIVSYTHHRKEYIGKIAEDGLYVACGGNGYTAMCSDAIGKIAAHVVLHGTFVQGFPKESFIPVFTK